MSKKKKTPPPDPQSLALPRVGVESHAHLDLEEFTEDMDAVLARAAACGVAEVGQVFLGPEAYAKGRERFAPYDNVFFILGMHPCDAAACDALTLDTMRKAFAEDARIKALGEIGLDYYWMETPKDVQQDVFRQQLRLALELDLRVVIHSREAEEDTVAVLDDMGFAGRPVLWHCFGRDAEFAAQLLDRGWHISIPGPVTYPKNAFLRDAVAAIPLERLLLETDCPFLAPQSYRGKRNEPAYLVFTAQTVAACKGLDTAALWKSCGDTARAFFGLPD